MAELKGNPLPDDSAQRMTVLPTEAGPAQTLGILSTSDPQSIGPYRIIEKIGEGGMGIVYKAEQRHPVRRLVALKVIKLGMDTREVVARFDIERQALALMSHPNVAKVLDADMTESGRPYFAMEFVAGVSLTEYCDQNKLSTRQRLELFIAVCQALHHAHQKGIIHRDLKPSNVLVTLFDGKPVPKVIDFGIAKAINTQLTQSTLYTQTGSLVGTPEYMSPEQAQTSGLDVDTRTDVYSLGVMLYELLTGALPFDPTELRKAGMEGMARMIRETEPPKPSTLLTIARPATPQTAARHNTDLRGLARELRGDLDWITLRAMEKDRTRRYDSAAALADDIRRYLNDEPVLASPPAFTYRLSKFVRKHRVSVGAAAAVLLALLLGITAAALAMFHARAERDRARVAEARESQQRQAAESAKVRADTANQFLRDLLFSFGGGQGSRVRLDASVARLDQGWLRDQPDTLIACRIALGYFYMSAKDAESAQLQFNAALVTSQTADGHVYPAVAGAAYDGLAAIATQQREYPAAARYHQLAFEGYRQTPGMEGSAADALRSLATDMERLGDAGGAKTQRMEAARVDLAGKDRELTAHPDDSSILSDRAIFRARLGRFPEAIADFARARALDPEGHWNYYVGACLELNMGDDAAYRKTAQHMLDRFASGSAPVVGERTAKVCLLLSPPIGDVNRLLELTQQAVQRGNKSLLPWFLLTQSLADYRAGHYEAAIADSSRAGSLDNGPGMLTAQLIAAMSNAKLGRDEDAKKQFDQVTEQAKTAVPQPGVENLGDVENFAVFQILRREAEGLIGNK